MARCKNNISLYPFELAAFHYSLGLRVYPELLIYSNSRFVSAGETAIFFVVTTLNM